MEDAGARRVGIGADGQPHGQRTRDELVCKHGLHAAFLRLNGDVRSHVKTHGYDSRLRAAVGQRRDDSAAELHAQGAGKGSVLGQRSLLLLGKLRERFHKGLVLALHGRGEADGLKRRDRRVVHHFQNRGLGALGRDGLRGFNIQRLGDRENDAFRQFDARLLPILVRFRLAAQNERGRGKRFLAGQAQ